VGKGGSKVEGMTDVMKDEDLKLKEMEATS
jgi:hypothetical protein